MQNRYVGDIGDFANNGLLRWLTGMTDPEMPEEKRLKLGVVSYLYHDTGKAGEITCYPRLREYDHVLYDTLYDLGHGGTRSVCAFNKSGMLPENTNHYDKCRCDFANRKDWLKCALSAVEGSQLVFLNPDNGILKGDIPDPDSPKHAYLEEIRSFVGQEHSLVIYQHPTRHHGKAKEQIRHFSTYLNEELKLTVRAFWFHKKIARFYFVVVHQNHTDVIAKRLESFHSSPWCAGKKPIFTFHDQNGKLLTPPEPCIP